MTDKLKKYLKADLPLPQSQYLWPLYGAGFENLGKNAAPIEAPISDINPDELLVRHDAVGLCFSDIKVINLGQNHPRIYRKMEKDPVVLGHEVSLTVVKVGKNLHAQYRPGDRFIIQADIFVDGVGYAYGYELQGGLSQFNRIDQRILNGDDGNYLIPVKSSTGFAESALTEPWACVTATYDLKYRTGLKPDGVTWIIGTEESLNRNYSISTGFDITSHPSKILFSQLPPDFAGWLSDCANNFGIDVTEVIDIHHPPVELVDDIVILGADPDLVETVCPFLADHGILAISTEHSFSRPVNVDVGRVHYNGWVIVGGTSADIADLYSSVPVRSSLKPGGRAWFVGAGGPMGHMHLQHALQVTGHPGSILCTDVSDMRLNDLCNGFAGEARDKGIEWLCLNPMNQVEYTKGLESFRDGFDDIVVLAPVPKVISESAQYLAKRGVLNIFAGVNRGVVAGLNLNETVLRGTRVIGHSASTIEDLRLMLHMAETGTLSPNRSVAAVGSLSAASDGLMALRDATYPGKVVIFPQIKEFPLTSLHDLKTKLPSVWNKLKNGREWTVEAEQEFLRLMLPD
jgi:D-arabinose 1-dehydrogenase-like Zn-dependent alcohol dehydrogenase